MKVTFVPTAGAGLVAVFDSARSTTELGAVTTLAKSSPEPLP